MKNISTIFFTAALSMSVQVFGQPLQKLSPKPDTQDTIIITLGSSMKPDCEAVENFNTIIDNHSTGVQSELFLPYSMQDSGYVFIFPTSTNPSYSVALNLDLDPLNGVNTFDLILISLHILNKELFTSPYQLISADANRSGTVTVFDIAELRKLILGTYTELPNNTSWRFIDKNQVFPDPLNPFAESLRHWINPVFGPKPWRADFRPIKTGDVDYTAMCNNFTETEDRNSTAWHFTAIDKTVQAGEEFEVSFTGDNYMAGFQMTLIAKGLSVVETLPEGNLTKDHFAVFRNSDRTNWVPVLTTAVETGDATFTVRFKAETEGNLSEMLRIGSAITPAMAFENNGVGHPLELRFSNQESLLQPAAVQPNPWKNNTAVKFDLPTNQQVLFRVYNSSGQLVYSKSAFYTAGNHQISLQKDDLKGAGTYFFTIDADTLTKSGKMELAGE